jgi:hypothetical protein
MEAMASPCLLSSPQIASAWYESPDPDDSKTKMFQTLEFHTLGTQLSTPRVLPLQVDRGVVYVIAHVRGGTDCGYGWYDPDGKMMKKKNSFLDFISAAEYLVKEKYTSEGKIAIQGGSAGCAHALPFFLVNLFCASWSLNCVCNMDMFFAPLMFQTQSYS